MKKFYTWFVILTVLLTPALAYADITEYIKSLPERGAAFGIELILSTAKTFGHVFLATVKGILLPTDLASGLPFILISLVWLLGIEAIRKLVGRLSGIFWAVFLGIAVVKTTIAVISSQSFGVQLVAFFLAIFLFSIVVLVPLKLVFGRLKSVATSSLSGENVSILHCAAGAFMVSCIINGRYGEQLVGGPYLRYTSACVGIAAGIVMLYGYWKDHRSPAQPRDQPPAPQPELQPVATVVPETLHREPAQPPVTVLERSRTQQTVECRNCKRQTPSGNYCNSCGGKLTEPTRQTPSSPPASALSPSSATTSMEDMEDEWAI